MTKCVQALAPSVYGGLAARVVAGWFQSALVTEGRMSVRHMNFFVLLQACQVGVLCRCAGI